MRTAFVCVLLWKLACYCSLINNSAVSIHDQNSIQSPRISIELASYSIQPDTYSDTLILTTSILLQLSILRRYLFHDNTSPQPVRTSGIDNSCQLITEARPQLVIGPDFLQFSSLPPLHHPPSIALSIPVLDHTWQSHL